MPPYAYFGEDAVPWRRTKIEVVEAFHGQLPTEYELLSPEVMPNQWLEADQEYILFIREVAVLDGDFTDDSGRYVFDEARLETFGGKGGFYMQPQVWVIDGDTAWRMPDDHLWV